MHIKPSAKKTKMWSFIIASAVFCGSALLAYYSQQVIRDNWGWWKKTEALGAPVTLSPSDGSAPQIHNQFYGPVGTVNNTGLGKEQSENLAQRLTRIEENQQVETQKRRLSEKFPIGWQLFGIDKDGIVYAKEGHFTESVDLAVNKVRISERTPSILEIYFPAIRGKSGNVIGIGVPQAANGEAFQTTIKIGKPGEAEILEARFRAFPRVGPMGVAFIGDLKLSCEVLEIGTDSIVFLAGLNKNLFSNSDALIHASTASSLTKFYDLCTHGQFEEVPHNFFPADAPANQKRELEDILNRTAQMLGKYTSGRNTVVQTKQLDDGSLLIRTVVESIYERGTANEVFIFQPSNHGMMLNNYHIDRKLSPAGK